MKKLRTIQKYWKHIIFSHLIHIVLTFLSVLILPKYSYQSEVLKVKNYLFAQFANFDGVHYLTNQYTHQPNFAFLPLYTMVCRSIVLFLDEYSILVLVILNKILFTLSIIDLLKIGQLLSLNNKDLHNAALLYILNPASVFFHSVYTQSLYSFLTFKFIVLVLKNKNFILPTLILSMSTLVRSTSVFLLPVIGLPILVNFIKNVYSFQIQKSILYLVKGMAILVLTLTPLVCYLVWGYNRLCQKNIQLQKCDEFFNVYSYVQEQHWNVGFLTYFKKQNFIFIIIGMPSVIIGLVSLKNIKMDEKRLGLNLSFVILMSITIFYTNIQSSTRFLCSHPLFYVHLSSLIKNPLVRFWQTGYFIVGLILFAVGFPWT